ncbi:hypothetical protein [Nocardioides sp.]|uniref:hypothetical protein n=1 Tax=Nocardioides sp. TaxID=35761 RepID=UPI002717CD83|nr:hypothetical protein [Nocardioides sp.]MDO9455320.1 hypothetical protein [Nocardioides sp.]
MWTVRTWAAASNEQAVTNARAASTECSRRRVERTEVELYLAARRRGARRGDDAHTVVTPAEHPAGTAARRTRLPG